MNNTILIASDIHGSAYWCEKVLTLFEKEKAHRLILLGDLLYHGPRNDFPKDYAPKKVFSMLNAVKDKISCVRGNCDSEVDQMVLEFPILADYALLEQNGHTLFLTHGHLYNAENPPLLQSGDLLFNGHFHSPCKQPLKNGATYVNCGSAALPKEGTPHSCILLKENKLFWIDLENGTVFDELSL